MKNRFPILTIVSTLTTAMILNGCTKLNETVYSELLADNFKPTANDVPSVIAPVYSNLRGMTAGWQGLFDLEEESADEIVTPVRPNGWYDGGTYQRMHRHTWTPTENQPRSLWINAFNGINTANRVIYQISSGQIPITTGKDNVIAEMKAARAFYYYLLCDNHGNVPIVTDYKNTDLPKQSTRQQIYDFVVKELTDNMSLLSENVDKLMYARFNKWAAKAVLAKMYLNAGVYTGTPKWAECIAVCDEIITQATTKGSYALEPRYKDIFKTNNEGSKELIFTVPYDETFATEFQIHMKTLDPLMQLVFPMQVQPWGGDCAVPEFIDTYDADDSRMKDTWIQGPQYNASTGALVITYTKSVKNIDLAGSSEGYRIGKYEIKPNAKAGLSNDFPIFRYADILMMKAECLLRTGHADDAAALVTQVRQRNFTSNPAKATVTGAQLQLGSSYQYGYWDNGAITQLQGGADIQYGRFLDELGWEFAAEAHRRSDIIRFGVYTTKMWFQHSGSNQDKTLFPVPTTEITKNPNLTQNHGY